MDNNYKKMNNKYLVCTRCFTYNHEQYIKDAMYGFVMQQTDFPVVYCIVDDASTDNNVMVIRDFMNDNFDLQEDNIAYQKETDYAFITFARHKTNKNCHFVVLFLKENHKSQNKKKIPYLQEWMKSAKYHAICEGDDYWIDPVKLKKQVRIMEDNPNVCLCGTNGYTVWDKGVKPVSYFNNIFESRMLQPNEVIGNWMFPTPSLFYRSELRDNYPDWTKRIYSGDQTLILIALSKGNIYASSDCTCVYRQNYSNPTSMTNRARADKNSVLFYYSQQILLYNEFSKYTYGKFDQWIRPTIKKLKKHHSFFNIKRRSIIVAALLYPSILMEIIKNKLKGL